jgi:hypothetical protein
MSVKDLKKIFIKTALKLMKNGENLPEIILDLINSDKIKNLKNPEIEEFCYIIHEIDSSDNDESIHIRLLHHQIINSEFNEDFKNFINENYPSKGLDSNGILNPYINYKTRMEYTKYLYEFGKKLLIDKNKIEINCNNSEIENNDTKSNEIDFSELENKSQYEEILNYGIKNCGYLNIEYSTIPINKFILPFTETKTQQTYDFREIITNYKYTTLLTIE